MEKENAQAILQEGIKMKGEDIDEYLAKFEELVRLAGYRFDMPQTIETFAEGLPMGLYQKILEMDRPNTYEQWKHAAIQRQQLYMRLKARLNTHRGRGTNHQPTWRGGWMPQGQLPDPNAMDTSAGQTQGRIMGSEDINFNTPPYAPQGGFLARQGGRGGRP